MLTLLLKILVSFIIFNYFTTFRGFFPPRPLNVVFAIFPSFFGEEVNIIYLLHLFVQLNDSIVSFSSVFLSFPALFRSWLLKYFRTGS